MGVSRIFLQEKNSSYYLVSGEVLVAERMSAIAK
jgi:hypothetical protein